MSKDYLKGKRCMVCSFMGNSRMYQALLNYGDRLDTVGIFTFEVDITGTITETGTSISSMLPYINRWPHIDWLLTVMNHGTASIFTALRNNENGAKTKFLSEIVRIMHKYPWCAGVDINLERGGGFENRDAANALFRDIYQTVKAYDSSKLVNICLPGMTGVQGSVGGENWCVSNTYYAAKLWMTGQYNFTGDQPPQPMIPIVAYWDDHDKVPWALPQVYDYMEGWDVTARVSPLVQEVYNRRRYLTCYGKTQKSEFGTIFVDRDGEPDEYTDGVVVGNGTITLSAADGTATYNFSLSLSGTYNVAVRICFPFWDKNGINISLDGNGVSFTENRLWWPYWKRTCWLILAKSKSLSAGSHTLMVDGGVVGVQFYGFRVCSSFNEEPSAGEAVFSLSPRSFKDVNGVMAVPDKGFKLTTEVLRRKPDSALAWYEDFRDPVTLQNTYWQTLSGSWAVWRSEEWSQERVYSQLEGSGQLAWKYTGFSDVHIRARIAFPHNGSGRAGVFIGNIFCCINIDAQRVELYQGSTLLGTYSASYVKTPAADIRTNPNMYLVEIRKRGNRVRVYSGNSNTLRFTVTVSPTSGYCGIQSDNEIKCELLRLGDAWAYESYEAFGVTMPNGSTMQYGRIPRSGVQMGTSRHCHLVAGARRYAALGGFAEADITEHINLALAPVDIGRRFCMQKKEEVLTE